MKVIIVHYSQTGNTKKVAEAIHAGISPLAETCDIGTVKEVGPQDLADYDLIGLGAPVWGGREPEVVTAFIEKVPSLEGKYGFAFCTHGMLPGKYIRRMDALLKGKDLTVTGWNDWFGDAFMANAPKPYYTEGHPDEIDLKDAEGWGKEIYERSQRISAGETQLIPELPDKETYDRLYGTMPQRDPDKVTMRSVMDDLVPRINAEKCRYPKCTLCMDHCAMLSIDLTKSPQFSYDTCYRCYFCEQICPTGAIEVNYEVFEKMGEKLHGGLIKIAEDLENNKELRRFRALVPFDEARRGKPLYTIDQHPRFVIRDGVGVLRETKKDRSI